MPWARKNRKVPSSTEDSKARLGELYEEGSGATSVQWGACRAPWSACPKANVGQLRQKAQLMGEGNLAVLRDLVHNGIELRLNEQPCLWHWQLLFFFFQPWHHVEVNLSCLSSSPKERLKPPQSELLKKTSDCPGQVAAAHILHHNVAFPSQHGPQPLPVSTSGNLWPVYVPSYLCGK